MNPERTQGLKIIAKDSNSKFQHLILTGQQDLCKSLSRHTLRKILESTAFNDLQVIMLDKCELDYFPDLNHCSKLEYIDISNNKLGSKDNDPIIPDLKLNNLKQLRLDGNPIPEIAFSLKDVPNLEKLSLGSKDTHTIGGEIIEKSIVKKSLLLQVNPEYRDYLTVPLLIPMYTGNIEDTDQTIQTSMTLRSMSVGSSASFPLAHSIPQTSLSRSTRSASMFAASGKELVPIAETSSNVTLPNFSFQRSPSYVSSTETLTEEENSLNLSKYYWKVKKVMDFRSIKDVLSRLPAMEYVLKEVNRSQSQYSLVLTSQADFYREHPDQFKRFLKHSGLTHLKYLFLNECDLPEIPDLSNLKSIHTIDISNNSIQSLASLDNESVRTLIATGNLFHTLDFDPDRLPSLSEVAFGSKKCQFISHIILQKTLESPLTLKLSDEHAENLIIPSVECLSNIQKLTTFVNNRKISPNEAYNSQPEKQVKYLQWLSKNREVQYEIFSLVGEGDFLRKTHFNLSDCFETSEALRYLKEVHLENCRLKDLPRMSSLSQVEIVDVRDNEIDVLDENCFPLSVKTLLVSGNPIHCVDIYGTKFKDLSQIQCGSKETHFISSSLMSRMLAGHLTVIVPHEHRQHLYLPPGAVFDEEKRLPEYVENPEKYLIHVPDIQNRVVALQWLIRDKTDFDKHDFDLYDWLFMTPDHTGNISIKNIKTLNVSHCNLNVLPDLKYLDSLERLILADNNLTDLSTLKLGHLEHIDIRLNPIEMVQINFDQCPKVKKIEVGSKELRFLAVEVLQKLSDGQLDVNLDEKYKQNMILPPPHLVTKGLQKEEIGEYLNNGEFDVSWYVLEDDDKDDDIDVGKLLEIFSMDRRNILTFKMTNQPGFAAQIDTNIDTLLDHDNLRNIKTLNVCNCQMRRTPSYQHLCQLTEVNLSGNQIGEDFGRLQEVIDHSTCSTSLSHLNLSNNGLKQIPAVTNILSLKVLNISNNSVESLENLVSDSLESLDVEANKFSTLDFSPERLPRLAWVSFGSDECKFVSFEVHRKAMYSELTLQLSEKYKQNLLIPLQHLLGNKEELGKYVNSKEMSLRQFNTSDIDQQMQCISRLMDYEGLQYDCFNLDGQVSFCSSAGIPKSLSLIPNITSLVLSNCSLITVPDLTSLIYLKFLVLRDNQIENCDHLENKSVNEIDIENNPIVGIDLDENRLPSLWEIRIGSVNIRYISFSLLKKVRDRNLTIKISEEHRKYLVFPSEQCMIDMNCLNVFVKKASFDLNSIPVKERAGALEWVTKHCGPDLKSLRLSREKQPEEREKEQMQMFPDRKAELGSELNLQSCVSLTEILIENCGLKQILDVSSLPHLEVIDARHNMIQEIDDTLLPMSIRILSIEGNPIEYLNINCSKFPHLRSLEFGSRFIRYVSFSVVRCLSHGNASIPLEYRQYLHLPPPALLENKDQLVHYCQNPERYLVEISDMEARSEALQWLFCRSGFPFSKLNFDSQAWLLDRRVDLSCISLNNIDTLILSNCDLETIPKFSDMSKLKHLAVSNNKLTDILLDEALVSLETLDLVGNSIRKIEIESEQFPELRRISFGSDQTWFVGPTVLSKFMTGTLSLHVPKIHQNSLLVPPWEIIEKGIGSVRKYTNSISLDVSHISDHEKKREAIEHQLSRHATNFTSLYFTNEKEYCQYIRHDGLTSLFQHQSLAFVKYLFISDCGLESIPDWNGMANLIFADVSGNKMDKVPRSDSIKELNISRTKFVKLVSFEQLFPSLVSVFVGSDLLKFVSFGLLKNKVSVTVDSRFRHALIMPPPCVLIDREKLGNYLKQPERSLVDVNADKLDEVVNWLVNEADLDSEEFQEMNLSHMNEIFGYSESKLSRCLHGQNVRKIKSLDLSHCQLNSLPDIEQLECLETLIVVGNNIVDISALRHPCLEYLDVSENPIETIDINFANCPQLAEIKVGSKETKCLSVGVLERACSDDFDFVVSIVEKYKSHIVVPPPHMVDRLKKNEVKPYLTQREFDVSWYVSEDHSNSGTVLDYFYCILSLDKRNILSFELCNFPNHPLVISSNLDRLLKHKHLSNVEEVIIRNCNIGYLPSFQHLSKLKEIDLSGNEIGSDNERIQIVRNPEDNLPFLTKVNLNNNCLTELPDLTNLASLEYLAIENNNVQSLADLQNKNLETLCVTENPCPVLDFDPEMAPSLNLVTFGSKMCQFIDFPILLKASTGQLTLQVDGLYKQYLMVPPPDALENIRDLSEYVQSKELSPNQFNACESELMLKCLLWLVGNRPYESLNLRGYPLEIAELQTLIFAIAQTTVDVDNLGNRQLHHELKEINLSNCKLGRIPDLSELQYLESVNFSGNYIQEINESHLPPSVEKISVEGNPIPCVKLICERFPNLVEICCGSPSTEYISAELIENFHEARLRITVHENYRKYLCMPPSIVFDSQEHLSNYVQNPEKYLPRILNVYKRSTALYWLLISSTFSLRTLDFTTQHWLFETDSSLNRIPLENVHTLILDKCGLQELPTLGGMPDIQILSLHDNELQGIQVYGVPLLQSLTVTKNPIEEIDVDFGSLPLLNVLAFGSDRTKFISLRVLNRLLDRNLDLRVPDEYTGYLLVPSWDIVEKGTKYIQDYMKCSTIDSCQISDCDNLKSAIHWRLERNMNILSACDLSGQKDLFRKMDISFLLGHDTLRFVTEIYLSDCGLDSLPDWSNLTNLKYADLSYNHLNTVLENPAIRRIDVTGNDIQILRFPKSDFPKLANVTAGSPALLYVSFDLLQTVAVEITDTYKCCLIMPPPLVLNQDTDLAAYLERPETYLTHVDCSQLEQAVEWLVDDDDIEITDLDLSKQNHIFGDINSFSFCIWQGRNLKNLRHLNLNQCQLDTLPEIQHLEQLEVLLMAHNNLTDISKLKHPCLQTIDVTENEIPDISVDFNFCPNLKTIKAGSPTTEGISINVLQRRVVTSDFVIDIADGYKESLVFPPPFIVDNSFNQGDIDEFHADGVFDVAWYVPKFRDPEVDVFEVLSNIISFDQHCIVSFRMHSVPDIALKIGNNIDKVLKHEHLKDLEHVLVSQCNMADMPSFQHFTKLTTIDLSKNWFENDVNRIFGGQTMSFLSFLNISYNQLRTVPDLANLVNLKELNVSHNEITTLAGMKNTSLESLTVDENPLETLDFSPDSVPSLKHVTFGSKTCHFVSFSILKDASNVKLQPTSKYREQLLFPHSDILETPLGVESFIKNKELKLNIFNASDPEQQYQCLVRFLEQNDIQYDVLNLGGESEFCEYVSIETLEDIISGLPEIERLDLTDCKLTRIPKIKVLNNLKYLDLKNNCIDIFDLDSTTLVDIDLQGNRIQGIDLACCSLPSLKRLVLGSECTKYISLRVLEKVREGLLDLHIPDEYAGYLIFPDGNCMRDKTSLWNFVDNPVLDLTKFNQSEKHDACQWVLEHDSAKLTSLKISCELEPDEDEQSTSFVSKIIECFDHYRWNLQQLKYLCITCCELDFVPDMSSMVNLWVLDLRCNNIENMNTEHLPPSVRKISVERNPIQFLDIDCSIFQQLNEITCGSLHTHYITPTVVKRMYEGDLNISVEEEFRPYLYLPPQAVFDDKETMLDYITHPERFLPSVAGIEERHEALQWLFLSSRSKFYNLDFSSQSWLFEEDADITCIEVIDVDNLDLSHCDLESIPKLANLSKTKHLDLTGNNLRTISTDEILSSLESLHVTDNPMKEIDFDTSYFPHLKVLSFGSRDTKFVSHRILTVASEISLCIPSEYQSDLLEPKWDIIKEGTAAIEAYMNSNVLKPSDIHDAMKWESIEWQLDKDEKTFTVMAFDNQQSFCEYIQQDGRDGLFRIFNHPSSVSLTEVYLVNCGLEFLPDWSAMKSLIHADVSGNKLVCVPKHPTLKSLNLNDNSMETLCLKKDNFPNLVHVKVGSASLRFIEFESLQRLTLEEYQNTLILPPVFILKDEKHFQQYVSEPTKYLEYVDKSEIGEALAWLSNEADFEFLTLDFSTQNLELGMLELFLKGMNLRALQYLNLNNCQLSKLPNLEDMRQLEQLFLAENEITDLSSLKQNELKYLDVTNNPISRIDVSFDDCPHLGRIIAGSESTESVSLRVLQRISDGELTINIGDFFKQFLLLPPQHIVDSNFDRNEVEKYLNEGTFDASWFVSEGKVSTGTLIDMLSLDDRFIRTFKMCNLPELLDDYESNLDALFEILNFNNIECLELKCCNLSSIPSHKHMSTLHKLDMSGNSLTELSKDTFHALSNITTLILRDCMLSEIPFSSTLENLDELDVGRNGITSLDFKGTFPKLKTLAIDQNPIKTLTFAKKQLPLLRNLKCGSSDLKFIGFEILTDTVWDHTGHSDNEHLNDTLKITLLQEFEKDLFMPPMREILENDEEKRKYLQTPELYLQYIEKVESRFEALMWLLDSGHSFETFSLAEQADLLSIENFNLVEVLGSECLKEIISLDLSRCDLRACPSLTHFKNLETLVLEHNSIDTLEELDAHSLTELNVVGNTIEEICWETDAFNNLGLIRIGSDETKFISHVVLQRKMENGMVIHVAEDYEDNLLCPTYSYLEKSDELQKYFDKPEIVLAELNRTEDEIKAFEWIIGGSQCKFQSLDLTKRSELFSDNTLDKTLNILGQHNMPNLSELKLQSCGLESIPVLDDLPLEDLDVSYNSITKLPKSLQFPRLRRLNLTGNGISCISLNLKSFKVLETLQCGSHDTKYISFSLIEACIQRKNLETKFKIEIDEDFDSKLLLPPAEYLKAENMGLLEEYFSHPETKLLHIDDLKDRGEALEWILTSEEKIFSTSFSLSNQEDLITYLGPEKIVDYLAYPELTEITELHLANCGLTAVPEVSTLSKLEKLDLQKNKLERIEISANMKFDTVGEINLTGNQIKVLDFSIESMDKLQVVRFGSTAARYIRLSFLKLLVSRNIQVIAEEGQVIFPPFGLLKGKEEDFSQLTELCNEPEKALEFVDNVEDKYELLTWLLDDNSFQTLNLTGQSDLVNYHPYKNFPNKTVLNYAEHAGIETLNLKKCDLKKCPNLASFPELKQLYLEDNLISEWTLQPEHKNLEILVLSGNPIPVISDHFKCFPSLKKLILGSEETEFISIKLLKRTEELQKKESMQSTDTLVIEVDENYKKHLILPHYSVFKQNSKTLLNYLHTPHDFLDKVSDISKRIKALQWLVKDFKDFGQPLESFSLTGQREICKRLRMSELEQIFRSLKEVKRLDLSKCGLKETPDISRLSNLDDLDLSDNNITEFSDSFSHSELKKLSIHGNSIKTVDVKQFPSLTYLECGCKENWRIDPQTLSMMYDKKMKLQIKIPNIKFQKSLEFPPYKCLEDGATAVEDFLNKEELDLSEIKRVDDDMERYILQVKNAENRFKSVRVSNVEFFLKMLDALITLLHDKNIQMKIERLRIQYCNLREFPPGFSLPNLKEVNLSNNKLRGNFDNLPKCLEVLRVRDCKLKKLPVVYGLKILDVGNNEIKSLTIDHDYSRLTELSIDGNRIDYITFESSNFPRLQTLTLGSTETRYISQKVLDLNISVIIPPEYQKYLLLPPAQLLNTLELDNYLKTPEKYIHVNYRESLKWLMEDRRDGVTEFDLSGQQKLCENLEIEGINQLLNNPKLVNIKLLQLDSCGLDSIPDLHHFANIESLSIIKNNITGISKDTKSSTLHTLHIEGNPIKTFDLDLSCLPSLKLISCGSDKTEEISPSILEQVAKGKLQLDVPPVYQGVLDAPPFKVLEGGKTIILKHLKAYQHNLSEVDFSLSVIGNLSIRYVNAIINKKTQILSLKLSRQEDMFKTKDVVNTFLENKQLKDLEELYMDKCRLEEIPKLQHLNNLIHLDLSSNSLHNGNLKKSLTLTNLNTLILRNTGLDRLPYLTCLPLLKHLDFSRNKLTDNYMNVFHEMSEPHPLESLDLSGNNIEKIDISKEKFPSLQKLTCGSYKTRFISFELIKAASEGCTVINVPDDEPNEYSKYLSVPLPSMLDNPSYSLAKFVKDTSVNLSEIEDIHQRNSAFLWLFAERKDFYKTLVLTDQSDFYSGKLLLSLLQQSSLKSITSLYLDKCGLDYIPLTKSISLPNLKLLDVSMNKITETTFSPHTKLQYLYIGGNRNKTIHIENMGNYPNLKFIHAGSARSW